MFDGEKRKWAEFWDFLQVTVDHNIQLSDIEKLLYLKGKLTGDAKDTISGIVISNKNCTVLKALLKQKFEDTEFVLHSLYIELINLKQANNNSKELRLLL